MIYYKLRNSLGFYDHSLSNTSNCNTHSLILKTNKTHQNQAMIWPIAVFFLLATCLQINCYKASHDPYSYQYNPYSYGYDVEDNYGNKQWRQEKSHNPMEVHGSYGYRDNNGLYREVVYIADKNGFRANIKSNEPGVEGTKGPASVKLDSYYPGPSTYIKHTASPSYYKQAKYE